MLRRTFLGVIADLFILPFVGKNTTLEKKDVFQKDYLAIYHINNCDLVWNGGRLPCRHLQINVGIPAQGEAKRFGSILDISGSESDVKAFENAFSRENRGELRTIIGKIVVKFTNFRIDFVSQKAPFHSHFHFDDVVADQTACVGETDGFSSYQYRV